MCEPGTKPLVLTGMMGSGKSTVGPLLAAELGRDFIDLDEMIEQVCSMQISQLLEEGETTFRAREKEALVAALQRGHSVIATGGGVILSSHNRQMLTGSSKVLLLEASLPELQKRLSMTDVSRPLLSGTESLIDQLAYLHRERHQLYLQTADIVVNTDKLTPVQVVAVIRNMLENSHV